MPCGVTAAFLIQVPAEGFRQVDTGLVGQADYNEQNISQLIGQLLFFNGGVPGGLLPVQPGYDPGQ